MTENDAKQKWCPFARSMSTTSPPQNANTISLQQAAAVNRTGNSVMWDSRCIANDCMMWRKHGLDSNDGFCGLAGHATLDVGR